MFSSQVDAPSQKEGVRTVPQEHSRQGVALVMRNRVGSAQQAPMHLKHPYRAQNVAQENLRARRADKALQFALIVKEGRMCRPKEPQPVFHVLQVRIQGQLRPSVFCVHLDSSRTLQWQQARQHAVRALP